MSNVFAYPFRVLIVEDELRDWAEPMKEALEDAAQQKNITITVDIAPDKVRAESLLCRHSYHIISLDMRLPERCGEIVTVDTGLELAGRFPGFGFPKMIIYSQTLHQEIIATRALTVACLPRDRYAKSSGSAAYDSNARFEVLTVWAWADRVVDYLVCTDKTISGASGEERETVIGSYLRHGAEYLPPVLAWQLQELDNHWGKRNPDRVRAALVFFEATARLALAQSLALISDDAILKEMPLTPDIHDCLCKLEKLMPDIGNCNWRNYLNEETLSGLHAALQEGNETFDGTSSNSAQKAWEAMQIPFLRVMGLAAYWVRHPLYINLHYTRDGWTGQMLAGLSQGVFSRVLLPSTVDFPREATDTSIPVVWQQVWSLPDSEYDTPTPHSVNWGSCLIPSPAPSRQWLFPIWKNKNETAYIDIITGKQISL